MPVTFSGSAADLGTLAQMLSECTGTTVQIDAATGRMSRTAGGRASAQSLLDVLDNLIGAAENLRVSVGRSQFGVGFDSYAKRTIDLDDLERLSPTRPDAAPSATTRCEVLIHIFAEYKFALHKGNLTGDAGFEEAHAAGVAAQTTWRMANGQAGPAHGNVLDGATLTFYYCDGSMTVVEFDETAGISRIRNIPPPPTPPPPPPGPLPAPQQRCLIATAAYGAAEVDEVLAPFRAFRDEVARDTRWGRRFFDRYEDVYYRFSPAIAEQMERDPEVRELIREVFVIPWMSYLGLAFARPSDWRLDADNRELAAFLEQLRAGLEQWADLVELPEAFDGLTDDEIVAELDILLGLVLKERGPAYLERLRTLGALPLRAEAEERRRLAQELQARGRSSAEIELILDGDAPWR
jgi:hypothetical protein